MAANILSTILGKAAGPAAYIGEQAAGYGVGEMVSTMLEPLTAETRQKIWSEMTVLAIPPADAADMVVQDILTEGEGASEAAKYGVSAQNFNHFVQVRGLPPGVMEMLVAWRRGIITADDFAQVVRESHTKTKYIPTLQALFWDVLSTPEAVELALKGAMTTDQMLAVTRQNGTRDEDARRMLAGTGNPIPPTQALELFRRGEMTWDEVSKAVRLGRTRDDQLPFLRKLVRRLPSLFEVRSMLAAGAITAADATKVITEQGYDPVIAAGMVKAGAHTRTRTLKQETESEILTLYEGRFITEERARALLAALGYDTEGVELAIALADARRERRFLTTAVNRAEAMYARHMVSKAQVRGYLGGLGIPTASIEHALETWDITREATVRRLTEAQTLKAAKQGLISGPDAYTRLTHMGYPSEDAWMLVAMELGADHVGVPKPPEGP